MRLFDKGTAKEYDFQNTRVVVGRSLECDFQIDDKVISRTHAVLFEEEGQWYLRDEKSTNGTWLNGKRLQAEEAYLLHENDEMLFAQRYQYVFNRTEKLRGEEEINKLIFLLENEMEVFEKSGYTNKKCIAAILFCLSRVPMYLPAELDMNVLFENKNPLETQEGDILTLKDDLPIKIKTICVNAEEEVVPIFTSKEAVEQGPSVSILKLWPETYLPYLIHIGKPVVINPFSKTRFILLSDWMSVVLDEAKKEEMVTNCLK